MKGRMKPALSLMMVLLTTALFAQTPTISSFSPSSGSIGTTVTITGTNFDTTPTNNIVYFGGVKATVSSASSTELTLEVPIGASTDMLYVNTGGLITESTSRFIVTFDSDGSIGRTPDTFADEATFTAGNRPYGLDLGDLDGDGLVDIATGNWGGENYSVFLNNSAGPGNISFASKVDFVSSAHVNDIELADLDGDGRLDIAAATEDDLGATYIEVMRSATATVGSVSFANDASITHDGVNYVLDVADFNADGKIDIVVLDSDNAVVSVYENSSTVGSVSFEDDVDFTIDSDPYDVAVGDINKDGLPDIITLDGSTNAISVLENTSMSGSISFTDKVDFAINPTNFSNWVEVADLNGDGLPEVIVQNDGSISIFKNETSISIALAAPEEIIMDTSTGDISIDDFNGDGKPDLLVKSIINQVAVLKNTSLGSTISFESDVKFSTSSGHYPITILSADLDGDGEPDIASSTSKNASAIGEFRVEILRNHSARSEFTDFSFDEQVAPATIDTDAQTIEITVVGVPDLTALTANFGLSLGASAAISGTSQISETTINNFTNPVTYTITAEDGSTTQDWIVTVNLTCSDDVIMLTEDACQSYDFDGEIINSSGTYRRDYINRFGCDSIVTLDLTISPIAFYENVYAVGAYDFDGATLTTSGQYKYGPFTSTETGCDSTFYLNLSIEPDTDDPQEYIQFQMQESKFPIITELGVSHIQDVNGDDEKDLFFIGKTSSGTIASLFINDGNGTFTEKTDHGIASAKVGNRSSLFLDVNEDDVLDFLVFGKAGSSTATKLYLNDGTGNFTEKADHGLPDLGIYVVTSYLDSADVDGDNDLDLVIAIYDQYNSYQPQLWLNNGDGSFVLSVAQDFPSSDESLADFADFDMDGDPDLLLRGRGLNKKLWINNGTGEFSQKLDESLTTLSSRGMVILDVDSDGDLDIYDSNTDDYSDLYTAIYFNNGDGSFTYDLSSEIPRLDGNAAEAGCLSKAADFDNDGDLDLIVEGRYRFTGGPPSADYLDVWLNNGFGHFKPLGSRTLNEVFPTDLYQFGRELGYGNYQANKTLSVYDFDSDGRVDILLSGQEYYDTFENVTRIFSNKGLSSELVIEACNSYEFYGVTLTSSGNYQGSYTDEFGNSYPVNLDLTISESGEYDVGMEVCGSSYEFGSQILTESGMYSENFLNQLGCDSTVNLAIGFMPEPDPDIEIHGVVLFAESESGSSYQWYNCDTEEPIDGEDKRQLTPPATGNYFVEVSNGLCSEISECVFFDWVLALDNSTTTGPVVYPNITTGEFTLDLGQTVKAIDIRILSMNGETVLREHYDSFSSGGLRINWPAGIYLLEVRSGGEIISTQRIIKN